MAYTRTANPYNSTPFSSCCGVASMGYNGRPASCCAKCGEPMTHHDDGLASVRAKTPAGHCLMCGKKRGNPAISGNCNC